ncbi:MULTISPECIES: branched-chain amino acid transport system II carrier protein [unclassified Luteococcus]|uniref:branched-chain amino acid transport system II carrier protein n=1 Tax=unclassified Luteococcus TaxID=2639923 RepID=UPI00313A7CB4
MSHTANARLRPGQTLLLASLTFGLFFGAGNLIFPVSLGLQSGRAVWVSVAGFLVAAVGLPILGVVASALAHATSLLELGQRVGPRFALWFTAALYLTIGPFFAIPRTATVSFELAFGARLSGHAKTLALLLFSLVFFAAVLAAALRPGRLLDYVGRYLTPVFLVLLGILLVVSLGRPAGPLPQPLGAYSAHPGAQGVLDGYNTMDALAGLAFAIVILEAVRRLGVTTPGRAAVEVAKAGVLAAFAMGVIYAALALLGARATSVVGRDANGAVALSAVAQHQFGPVGHALAAAIMLVACLKTAIGLATSCVQMFGAMFPGRLSAKSWAVLFTGVAFGLANVGLARIISAAVPVLQLLYPLAVGLILLALLDRWLGQRPWPNRLAIGLIGLVSAMALVTTLPGIPVAVSNGVLAVGGFLPGFELGFGWILPGLVGIVLGLFIPRASKQ